MSSALFIHRSVGLQMLDAASVRTRLSDVELSDLYANTNVMRGPSGEAVATELDLSSGNTNPDGLAAFFRDVLAVHTKMAALEAFEVVAFKSCYSASGISSTEQLEDYRACYEGPIAQYIDTHSSQRFVILSPPPRRPLLTSAAAAHRAREFSKWLADFAHGRRNCSYFDLFACLASQGDVLDRKYRRLLPIDQHPNARGAAMAGEALTEAIQAAGLLVGQSI
jgi:hypothetical protein